MVRSAAPERARCPRWITCQSVMQPSTAEYWHIGAMTIRLASVSEPMRKGSNSFGLLIGVSRSPGGAAAGPAGEPAGVNHRQQSNHEDSVERPRTPDRGDRCTQTANAAEVHEIGANQDTEAPADIGECAGMAPREDQRDDRRHHGGD